MTIDSDKVPDIADEAREMVYGVSSGLVGVPVEELVNDRMDMRRVRSTGRIKREDAGDLIRTLLDPDADEIKVSIWDIKDGLGDGSGHVMLTAYGYSSKVCVVRKDTGLDSKGARDVSKERRYFWCYVCPVCGRTCWNLYTYTGDIWKCKKCNKLFKSSRESMRKRFCLDSVENVLKFLLKSI
jgi:ssDNA-binding Zn-finger/Zn-ribbon topoisomerase 1